MSAATTKNWTRKFSYCLPGRKYVHGGRQYVENGFWQKTGRTVIAQYRVLLKRWLSLMCRIRFYLYVSRLSYGDRASHGVCSDRRQCTWQSFFSDSILIFVVLSFACTDVWNKICLFIILYRFDFSGSQMISRHYHKAHQNYFYLIYTSRTKLDF